MLAENEQSNRLRRQVLKALPVRNLIQELADIQDDVDSVLTIAVIERSIADETRLAVSSNLNLTRLYKDELLDRFDNCSSRFRGDIDETTVSLTADRFMYLASLGSTLNVLRSAALRVDTPLESVFYFAHPMGVIAEALATLPISNRVIGFKVTTEGENKKKGAFFVDEGEEKLSAINFTLSTEEKEALNLSRKGKNIVMVVEGDIAGHAIRALVTARGLRDLGYEPKILGTGYLMSFFARESFDLVSTLDSTGGEGERLITLLRGEGFGIFPWNFEAVRSRMDQVQGMCYELVRSGLDLLISDMNPIATIALQQLGNYYDKPFVSVTQTHDLKFSPKESLRSLRFKGVPVGRWTDDMRNSRFFSKIDPGQKIYGFIFETLRQAVDVLAGLPLVMNDRLQSPKADSSSARKFKLTDYFFGKDGTIIFGLDPQVEGKDHYWVGLQSDRDFFDNQIDVLTHPFILHMQGSTYNKQVWELLKRVTTYIPDSFSVHTTGKKEDPLTSIDSQGGAVSLIIGYTDGFTLAGKADVLINHGGFGTISQWLLATAERFIQDREELKTLILTQEEGQIGQFLSSLKGPSRSISVCNTFEQENNARRLNTMGSENVCSVFTADDLLTNPRAEQVIYQLIKAKLANPLDDKEKAFWSDLTKMVAAMNAPAHTALILERMMFV